MHDLRGELFAEIWVTFLNMCHMRITVEFGDDINSNVVEGEVLEHQARRSLEAVLEIRKWPA